MSANKATKMGMFAGTLALLAALAYPLNHVATTIYNAQEILAALLLLSIGFASIALLILILFLLDLGLRRVLRWTGLRTVEAAHWLVRGWVHVEHKSR